MEMVHPRSPSYKRDDRLIAGFRELSVGDLCELPPPIWIVEGLIPDASIVCLYGQPGAGKTFVALELSWAVATGHPFLGHHTQRRSVVYLPAEGLSGLSSRFLALMTAECNSATPRLEGLDGLSVMKADERGPLQLNDHPRVKEFGAGLWAAKGPCVVIFDPLLLAMGEESDKFNETMGRVMKGAAILRDRGHTVVLIHHSTKTDSRVELGHIALKAAADTMLQVEKNARYATLTVMKQRDAGESPPLDFVLKEIDLGDGCVGVVVEGVPDGRARSSVALNWPRVLLQALAEAGRPLGAKAWQESAGCTRKETFQDARLALLTDRLVHQPSARAPYTITEAGSKVLAESTTVHGPAPTRSVQLPSL